MELESKVLSKQIQEYLYNYDGTQRSLGTAESCTGGRVAETIMSVPGSSNYYKGSVIAYSNEVKENILGVDAQLIEEKTAVSEEVAKEMALGAAKRLGADFAVATTGIAGPNCDGTDKPVGLVYIGIYAQGDISVRECFFTGDRELIRYRTSVEALEEVRRNILKKL